ncbi:protein-disulfide reductase DsbD, partial [Salmonella enterica subsp. enterica serovar Bovismorbificans]|nr:protein-disulfide reductase DsbD [Salmonella enterica subsp. enterica serovar Bovismorbificans]
MAHRILTLILLFCSAHASASLFGQQNASQFVPADQAFAFDFQQQKNTLTLNWQIKPGYYLYRQQIRVTPASASVTPLALPTGEPHEDEFFGKSEIYRDALSVPITVEQASPGATLSVTYQGCAEAGFCYPPETRTVPLSVVEPTD